jgi:hypothetical protein
MVNINQSINQLFFYLFNDIKSIPIWMISPNDTQFFWMKIWLDVFDIFQYIKLIHDNIIEGLALDYLFMILQKTILL